MEGYEVIWEQHPCSAHEIIKALSANGWKSTTVKTFLNRLIGKNALGFHKTGNSYIYYPIFGKEECRADEAEFFLNRVFDGKLWLMLSYFIQRRRLNRKSLSSLRKFLKGESVLKD